MLYDRQFELDLGKLADKANWRNALVLNDRERQEIAFAMEYSLNYGHGTSGHLSYTVLAKLAAILDYLTKESTDAAVQA